MSFLTKATITSRGEGVTTVSNAWLACQNNLHLGSHKIGNGGGCHVMTPMSQYDAAKG